ncbi:MAG: F0F1 ATP synthase subunit epsilon [bacterium]|nr:F0F1 ATP synthase subunit epsilon [bacterium]
MEVEILTPKGLEFKGEADVLILPTLAGEISVLPQHTPLVTVLKPGRMKIKTSKDEILKEIEGGILEVSDNKATILLKKF